VLVLFAVGTLFGAVEVAVTAAADGLGGTAAAGPLLALWGAGSLLGGLIAVRCGRALEGAGGLALVLAVLTGGHLLLVPAAGSLLALGAALLVAGTAIALVQTPALTGATRSPAGQRGTGLGLFNMMRFVGAASGTAAVAAAWPDGLFWLFAGCGAVALGGLVVSFLGREVPDRPAA
jgi:hypothetical protein